MLGPNGIACGDIHRTAVGEVQLGEGADDAHEGEHQGEHRDGADGPIEPEAEQREQHGCEHQLERPVGSVERAGQIASGRSGISSHVVVGFRAPVREG